MIPRVGSVGSYGETAAIEAFIAAALEADPATADWLRQADPARLIVVKPNWVQECHETEPEVWEPVITHPQIVLAVVAGLAERMQGQGTIAVCDAPHTYANFERIVARGGLRSRLEDIRARWPALGLELLDLRRERWVRKEEVVVERLALPPDPRGYVRVDLASDSLFWRHAGEGRYYGADYDRKVVNRHHRGALHEYLLSGTAMACDLFVNLPKLKTHKKTGITCCLKNLVGINGDKNWLPHYTEGGPRTGGDEFPRDTWLTQAERTIKRLGMQIALGVPGGTWIYRKARNTGKAILGDSERTTRNGNWSGNDTCWRMALDLNRALLHGESSGRLGASGPRRYLAIVDGILGGQGNGPLCPDPAWSGVLIAGTNPAEVDAVASRLMGFDPNALPIVGEAFRERRWPIVQGRLEDVRVEDARCGATVPLADLNPAIPGGFRPHLGWTHALAGPGVPPWSDGSGVDRSGASVRPPRG